MARVLVLGGNGFIGRNLVDFCAKMGEEVISFDVQMPNEKKPGVLYVQADFFDTSNLEKNTEDIDIVYHCICTINPGNSEERHLQGYERDFIQTVRLIDIVKQKKIKMIFLSSGGTVYGKQEQLPIRENSVANPINHYGNLKLCIENTIRIFNLQDDTNIKIARISNPYGPGQDYGKGVGFVDAVLKCGIEKRPITVWGNGDVVRDYIYIDDVCSMLYALAYYKGDEDVFNLSTGVGKNQNDIIDIAKKWFGEMDVKYMEARPVDVPQSVLDNSKILEVYKGKITSLEEGMETYYKYLNA